MPNVFNKNPSDYVYLHEQRGERSDRQFRDALKRSGCNINWDHDFRRQNFDSSAQADSAAFGLVLNNLEAMQAEIEEVLRERFKIPEFVPINTAIPEGATSYALRVINRFGKGKFINRDGSNVENATASVDKLVFNVEYAGIQPQWTLQELREVLFTGISLSNETLEAGTQGALDHIQEVGFNGDSDLGFTGLLNDANVPVYGGTTPIIAAGTAATDDAIASYINSLITTIGATTNELVYEHFGMNELTIVLPTASFDYLSTTRMGTDANKTIMQYLTRNNVWTARTGKNIVFKSLPRALAAAATGTGRAIVYPWNKRIIEMAIPIMPRIITTDSSAGYVIKAPMEYSMGGVVIKRADMMIYGDEIVTAGA
jgi:hypothetical protein